MNTDHSYSYDADHLSNAEYVQAYLQSEAELKAMHARHCYHRSQTDSDNENRRYYREMAIILQAESAFMYADARGE